MTEQKQAEAQAEAQQQAVKVLVKPRVYLNGFPKSGLHLALNMARCVVSGPAREVRPWAGTFQDNSFGEKWAGEAHIWSSLALLHEDTWLKGHAGYRDDIADFLNKLGACVVFIYRDLRDVAVSLSYHVVDEDDQRFMHPDKAWYRRLGSHEEVLKAVIAGDERFPGLLQRWAYYAPWLDVPWVLSLTYADMRERPEETASLFVRYIYGHTAAWLGFPDIHIPEADHDWVVEKLVEALGVTDGSPTYRKGTTGQWRDEFTPEIVDLFKACDTENWLVRLGFEKDADW